MKTCPKSLNYRYAQSLDNSTDERILQALESRSQSPNTICQGSLTSYYKISFIKTPFTIKFLHKKFVYYKSVNHFHSVSLSHRGATFLSLLFTACIIPSYFFFLPHYDTKLHIAVIIIFYLGPTRFFKKLFPILSFTII